MSEERRQRKAIAHRRWVENLSPERRAEFFRRKRDVWEAWEARQDPDKMAALQRKWRETYYEKRRRQNRNLRRARERVAAWSRANPERVDERRRRYVLAHPERVRESKRGYYHRHADEIRERRFAREDPEKVTADQRRWRASYVRKGESTWTPTEEQRAAYRRASADRRRLARRLAAAGLPPRRLQPVTAAQRRFNMREAEAFFTRRRSKVERDAIARQGERTPRALYYRFLDELRVDSAHRELAAVAREQLRRHRAQLQADLALDARARAARGAPPADHEIALYRELTELVNRAAPKLSASIPPFAIVPARGWAPAGSRDRGRDSLGR